MPPKQVTSDGEDLPTPPEWDENGLCAFETKLLRRLSQETGSSEAARDIAQEAYRRFYEMPEDRRLRNPAGYLFTIALNLVKEELRERESGVIDFNSSAADDVGFKLENEGPSAYDTLSIRETLQKALADMPSDQRHILLLSKVGGLSHREIAERLGRKIGTVKKLAARALRRAREALARDGQT